MKEKKSVMMFLAITIVMSAIVDVLWIKGGETATAKGISALLMFCPAIAAFIVRGIYYRKEKLLGLNKCKSSYILAAIVLPLLYLGVSYGLYWLLKSGSFTGELHLGNSAAGTYTEKATSPIGYAITWIAIISSSILAAAGEEIGWRGFLLPQMSKIWNFKKAVIVSGLIWAVWHFPIILAGLYNPGTPMWYLLPMFVIDVLSFTIIISILRVKSHSVWPAIILHASHNYFDQALFGPMTSSANKAYFVGETGFLTVVALIIVTVCVVKFFRKATPPHYLTV